MSIYYAEFCKSKIDIIRTLKKIFLALAAIFILLFVMVLLLFKSYRVQTYFAHQITSYLSKEWKTEVALEKIEIDFPNTLVLNQFLIRDLQKDTLIFTDKLELSLLPIDWSFQDIQIQSIKLNQPYFNYYSTNRETSNLSFLLEQFKSSNDSTRSPLLSAGEIHIKSGKFRYHLNHYPDSAEFGINFNHLDISDVNLAAKDFLYENSNTKAVVDSLSLKESSGFKINRLATFFNMTDSLMDFKNLELETPISNVQADYAMSYNSFSDFSKFINQVELVATFSQSTIATKDLSYFSSELVGLDLDVKLNGDVKGTIDNLKGRKINLSIDSETTLNGRFDLRGLPNVEETYIYMKLDNLSTSMTALSRVPFPPFKENNRLHIPENMYSLGDLLFKGEFTGFYNDFVAYGILDTDLGKVKTDLLLSEDEDGMFKYSGDVYSKAFKIGKMIEFPQLSKVGLNVEIKGKGTTAENAIAQIKGKVQSLTLYNYEYNDITVVGDLSNQKFKGDLTLRDENLKFDFKGLLDLSQKEAIYNFDLDLIEGKLAKLNLFHQEDTMTDIKFKASLNLVGNHLDNIRGNANIDSLRYQDSELDQFVETIELAAEGSFENRKINLKSNLVDAEVDGKIYFDELPNTLIKYIDYYLPHKTNSRSFKKEQIFTYNIYLKDINPINQIFYPELKVDTNTLISGKFNSKSHSSIMNLNSKSISVNDISLRNIDLDLRSNYDSIGMDLKSEKIQLNRVEFFEPKLTSNLDSGKLIAKLQWYTDSSNLSNGNVNIVGQVYSLDSLRLSLLDSYFYLGDSLWQFLSPNQIVFRDSAIQVEQLKLQNINQSIAIDGIIGQSKNDSLKVNFNQMNLEYLSNLLPKDVVDLGGVVNGKSKVKKYNNEFAISSNLKFKDLSVNGTHIGNSFIKSDWMPDLKAFKIIASLGEEESEAFSISGTVHPFEEENSLDLVVNFNQTPIAVLKPYLTDYVTEVEGTLDGRIQIEGQTSKPMIDGRIKLQNSEFRIVYLNTKYFIDDEIVIKHDFIGFDLIKIKDENGQVAIGTGTIFHDNYSDFNLDIGLEFNNFLALNTNSSHNDLYYGKAIASGAGNISGYADQLIIEFEASTEKGTLFNVPISTDVEASSLDFIQFTNSHIELEKKQEIDLKGIQMNFDLNVKPETKIRIIFDEQVGDVMNGMGEGNIKLEINTLGNFNMYGQYTVNKGDYLFTLQNIINKKFDIAAGSTVSWDGDPYAAKIDIKAIYNLRASLYDLIPDDSTINTKRRVPVELELQLTEQLLNPEIGFDIRLPSSGENVKRRLESILYLNSSDMNKQEVNQQVFGLLVLNRFLPPSSGIVNQNQVDRGTPGVNNGYELISNQLSNWLSKVSNQFDIGINYRPGDEIANEELDFSVSTEVLNERLVLDGNFGYTNSSNTIEDNQNSTNFIGEFSAEYKISKDGRFRLRGFNRSANNNLLQNFSPYTQGIGIFYRKEFDTFEELWRSYFSKAKDE